MRAASRVAGAIAIGIGTTMAAVPAAAGGAAPATGCMVQAWAPYRAGDGSIVGQGWTSCAGYIRLMERRIFWADRVLTRVDFTANPDPLRVVIRQCSGGGDGGDVYVEVHANATDETRRSDTTYFGYCT